MLVLTRRIGEQVVLRDLSRPGVELTVTVRLIDGGRVRIGFETPSGWKVIRREIDRDGRDGGESTDAGRRIQSDNHR